MIVLTIDTFLFMHAVKAGIQFAREWVGEGGH